MKNILIVSGHTSLKKHSVTNKSILAELEKHFPTAEFVYLDTLYPNYDINTKVEQSKLLKADIVVLQFPIHWYGVPSLLSRWFEEVLTYGFAYGDGGDKLKNKKLILSYSSGGPEEAYSAAGFQKRPIGEYLHSLIQTGSLCGFDLVGQIYTGGMNANHSDPKIMKTIHDKALLHSRKLIAAIESIE